MHGRAGREGDEGHVIVQTYNPESFPIECAKEQDYQKFYNQEIKLRKVLKYPPFCDIIKIEVSDFDEKNTQNIINAIYDNLLKVNMDKQKGATNTANIQVYAPMPSPINKIQNRYRWRIIIKCKLGGNVINKINSCISAIKTSNNTRISVDINPNNMN